MCTVTSEIGFRPGSLKPFPTLCQDMANLYAVGSTKLGRELKGHYQISPFVYPITHQTYINHSGQRFQRS